MTTSRRHKVREENHEVVVIGAGMAGLMAATTLADRDVVVLEASVRAGGRVDTVRKGDYWINVGTQFTEGTGPLIDALHRHEVPLGTLEGKSVALSLNGTQVDTSNPFALMFKSKMTWRDRFGLAGVGQPGRSIAPIKGGPENGRSPAQSRRADQVQHSCPRR